MLASRPLPRGLHVIAAWLLALGVACSFPDVVVQEETESQRFCEDDDDCPQASSPCERARCSPETGCATIDVAPGTPCEGADGICLMGGTCGECDDEHPCVDAGEDCSPDGTCVPAHCLNEDTDADETGLNCGGPTCPPCTKDEGCAVSEDCMSGYCDTTLAPPTCQPCDGVNDCPSMQFCNDDSVCQPVLGNGSLCRVDTDCASNHCATEAGDVGVCCEEACDGVCESCLKAGHQMAGQNGFCHPVADGLDPKDDCPQLTDIFLERVCDGDRSCRFK